MTSSYKIPAAIVFGGILIAGAVYISMPKKDPAVVAIHPELMRPVDPSDHIFGNPAAPVMIVEYCDFDSEYCKVFHDTMHQIIANQGAGGKVAWVFREFPLTEVHPNSLALARAAECAATSAKSDAVVSNDAFWNVADALFEGQPIDLSSLSAIASAAGISGAAFATCYANTPRELSDRINADRQNALDMQATGAPLSILLADGKSPVVMDGAYPYDAVQELVTQALRKN